MIQKVLLYCSQCFSQKSWRSPTKVFNVLVDLNQVIESIVKMGFERPQVEEALNYAQGEQELAIEFLINVDYRTRATQRKRKTTRTKKKTQFSGTFKTSSSKTLKTPLQFTRTTVSSTQSLRLCLIFDRN